MIIVIIGTICVLLGGGITYLLLRPSRLKVISQNEENKQVNSDVENQLNKNSAKLVTIQQDIRVLEEKKTGLNDFVKQQEELINEKLSRANEALSQKYKEAEEQYLTILEENKAQVEIKNLELQEVQNKLNKAISSQAAVIELLKREEEKKNQASFYTLQLSDDDLKEIDKLREIAPFFRNAEPLYKIIWKSYYEKPFTDLIGRLIDTSSPVCGIYKITNLENQKVYIGQSVDIKTRLRTHIKKGLGAETPSRNKLYLAMNKEGVENFSYEIIEKCPREDLNDKERYWINYFKSQDFGYNETKGG